MERQRCYLGQRVKWNDPGVKDYDSEDREDVLNRVFIIADIDEADEDDPDRQVYLVEENGFSEAEAWEHELIAI